MAKTKLSNDRTDPVPKVAMRDFHGLISNVDPRDIQPGASQHQINVVANHPAEIRVRQGITLVQFDS